MARSGPSDTLQADITGANRKKRRAAMVDERRARVASLKVRGFSIRQIEAELVKAGVVNPDTGKPWGTSTIGEDVAFLDASWRAKAASDTSEWGARELAGLDEAEREAWAAWHRGIGKKQQTFSERKDGAGKQEGGSKASVRTDDINGDPRYLSVILECQQRRAQLLGLDAPTRSEVKIETPGVMIVPVAGSVAEWEASAEAAQAALKAGAAT